MAALGHRLLTLSETPPLPFRSQNGGDYDADLELRPEVAADEQGLRARYGTLR